MVEGDGKADDEVVHEDDGEAVREEDAVVDRVDDDGDDGDGVSVHDDVSIQGVVPIRGHREDALGRIEERRLSHQQC